MAKGALITIGSIVDEITNLPLETCLLKLAYDADRAELEKMLYENATSKVQM